MKNSIGIKDVKKLRSITGAGIMDCKKALMNTNNNLEEAIQLLQINNEIFAKKKSDKPVYEGIIESYIHTGNKIGVLIELNCETDFVSKKLEFKELAKNIAMQIASSLNIEKILKDNSILLEQTYIKNPNITISQLIKNHIALFGENIKINRFVYFKLND